MGSSGPIVSTKIRDSIDDMESGKLSPLEVNDRIHTFHDGASRDLYRRFYQTLPWISVCHAYVEGILTDEDLSKASDRIRSGIAHFASSYAALHLQPDAAHDA